jgi:hypothetical protein
MKNNIEQIKNSKFLHNLFIHKTVLFFSILFLLGTLFIPDTSFSASASSDACSWNNSGGVYCMLAPLGNYVGEGGKLNITGGGLSQYLNALFKMGIVLATGLAVIMITMGGLKYASTDAIEGKSDGKKMIQDALLGLVLALMSVLILGQINSQLLSSDLNVKALPHLEGIDPTNITLSSDQTTQDYAKKGDNPMIDTSGVVYADGPGTEIGGGNVAIDYDGSPGVYKVVEDPNGKYLINGKRYSSVGYEELSNAQSSTGSGAWVGVQTDSNGQPIIGADGNLTPQLSYGTGRINGNQTPFVALSTDQYNAARRVNPNFKLGDKVYLTANGKTVEAIYADNAGKRDQNYAEVSPAAASALGIDFNKRGTTSSNASVTISVDPVL